MSKNETRAQEPAKTIKVSTLIIAVVVLIVVVTAFIGGWMARSNDMARVQAEANALVQTQLKASK